MTEKYIIANYKCSGFYFQVMSLSDDELNKWVKFFRDRERETDCQTDEDSFEIWEYNDDNLYYAINLDWHKEKPTNLIETMLII